jgi:hypothetical protein
MKDKTVEIIEEVGRVISEIVKSVVRIISREEKRP